MNNCLISSCFDDWETPLDLFQALDSEFHFTLDPCADPNNAKCSRFFTVRENGLLQSWAGHSVFCNPPYGRSISSWIRKCYEESFSAKVVALIPARTDTSYFHDYILGKSEIRFIRGRLYFKRGSFSGRAPFPSMIVIW